MPNLTGKTVNELRAMSQPEIAAAITAWCDAQTKKQLIEFEMDATEFADTPVVTHGEHGILTREQSVRDALGDVLRVEGMEWSYYAGGEVDEITTVVENANGDVIEDRYIKHYTDKQPDGHLVLTVVFAPQDVSGITAPIPANYWRLIDIGEHASLWCADAPAPVLLDLHGELWNISPAGIFGILAVASARGDFFLPAAVRHHASMTVAEALARRNRIADYLDSLGKDTTLLRTATNEHDQMIAITKALGYTPGQLWAAMGR